MPAAHPSRDEGPRLPSWEALRASLWFWPAVAAAVGFVVAAVLGNIQPTAGSRLARWAWPGDHGSAIAFLQVVAGSVMTVTSLTFTLVVVALQLASQQFSPRLLREFARDLLTQLVLAILVTTFVVAVTVLRSVDESEPLPAVGLALVFVMALLSVAALLGFLGHIARFVRVDTMMAAVHRETRDAIEHHYLPYGHEQGRYDVPSHGADEGILVAAEKSGFVQDLKIADLVACADDADALVIVGVRPGDHVVVGTPVACVVGAAQEHEAMTRAVRASIILGYERTLEGDVALGLRQLADIAVKALSPGVNDPTTAGHAIGHITDLLVRLQGRRLGPFVHFGDSGKARVQTQDRDFRYYLDLVVGAIRPHAAREPLIMIALLRMLRDVAVGTRDAEQRHEVMRQAELVVATAPNDLLEADAGAVRDAHRRVDDALNGDAAKAYGDRAGETRSL